MRQRPPTRSKPHAPPLRHPFHRGRNLLVDCCILSLNSGHLRPRPRPSLCFLMDLFLETQTGKPAIAPPNPTTGALRGTIGIGGAIGWGHRCTTHGDRGAKLLEGRAPVKLFLVFLVVFFLGRDSTRTQFFKV